jgi:hypothetical protein
MERGSIVDISLSFAGGSRPKSGTADYNEHETRTNQLCNANAAVSFLLCLAEHGARAAQKRANSKKIPNISKEFPRKLGAFPAKTPTRSTPNPCYSPPAKPKSAPPNRTKSTP